MSAPYTTVTVWLDDHCDRTPEIESHVGRTDEHGVRMNVYVQGSSGYLNISTGDPNRMRALATACFDAAERAEEMLAGSASVEEVAAS